MYDKININKLKRNRESKIYYIALIFLTAVFIILTLEGGTGFTGTFSRIIGFIILAIFGYGLLDWSSAVTEKHVFWREKEELDEEVNLRMHGTSKILERALDGEKTSQKALLEKMRKTFFIKLKEKRNLTDDDLQELLIDEKKLRKIVQDEVISKFILSELNEKERGKEEGIFSTNKDQRKKIEHLIRRIEKWD